MSSTDKLDQAQKIDTLAHSTLLKSNSQLEHALSNSAANKLPAMTISPLQGQYLAVQCRLLGAESVLEIGTLGGYSTIWFASTGAKVTSIEISPKNRDVALENTKGLDVDVILDVLPKLATEGHKFDFIFIDAAWEEQFAYFEWAVKLARTIGCIYVDNVVREILESWKEDGEDKKETLLGKVGGLKDSGVTATLVPTVSGHKGKSEEMFDGFPLVVVGGK